MSSKEKFSDDYIAKLLANDAKTFIDKYSSSSLDALKPTTLSKNKPKPNTRFLKNIIKETDSHNAALRAKEVQDAKSRLQRLQGAQEESSESKDRMGDEVYHRQKRRRIDHSEVVLKKTHRKPLEESKGDSSRESKRSRRYHEHDQTGDVDNSEDERTRHRRHRHRHRSHRPRSRERSRDRDNRAPRRRSSRRRDLSNLSDGDRGDRHDRKRRRRRPASLSSSTDSALPHSVDRRISGTSASPQSEMEKDKGARQQKSIGNESDSDPLESIIGPLPPHVPKIQARGRGTFKSSSTIDSHFSSKYDPSEDVHPNSDSETSWDQALEALRDRQRWKQQGANRLRSAGFTEEVVGKWERGGEKKQEDVRWSGKGEKREWDRGKIMGETGVETKAEWALSKGIESFAEFDFLGQDYSNILVFVFVVSLYLRQSFSTSPILTSLYIQHKPELSAYPTKIPFNQPTPFDRTHKQNSDLAELTEAII